MNRPWMIKSIRDGYLGITLEEDVAKMSPEKLKRLVTFFELIKDETGFEISFENTQIKIPEHVVTMLGQKRETIGSYIQSFNVGVSREIIKPEDDIFGCILHVENPSYLRNLLRLAKRRLEYRSKNNENNKFWITLRNNKLYFDNKEIPFNQKDGNTPKYEKILRSIIKSIPDGGRVSFEDISRSVPGKITKQVIQNALISENSTFFKGSRIKKLGIKFRPHEETPLFETKGRFLIFNNSK